MTSYSIIHFLMIHFLCWDIISVYTHNIDTIKTLSILKSDLPHLIQDMLHPQPDKRPTMEKVKQRMRNLRLPEVSMDMLARIADMNRMLLSLKDNVEDNNSRMDGFDNRFAQLQKQVCL